MDLVVSMDEVWQFGRPNDPELLPGCGENGKMCPLLSQWGNKRGQLSSKINRSHTIDLSVSQVFFSSDSYCNKLTSVGVCSFFFSGRKERVFNCRHIRLRNLSSRSAERRISCNISCSMFFPHVKSSVNVGVLVRSF